MDKNNAGTKKIMIAGSAVTVVVIVLIVIFINSGSDQRKLTGLLDLGQKYLEELSYEDAILVFDEAIAIDPKCAQAYMGKARAQYALEQYEEAVATLREGIERVDDSTELEAYLQKILDEMSERVADKEAVEELEQAEAPLLLNYSVIVRRVDTEEADIQLEILGDNVSGSYTWTSSNTDSAIVSETGLVTCLPVAGEASITVTDEKGRWDNCSIRIVESEEYEYENARFEMGDGKLAEDWYLTASLNGDRDGMMIIPGHNEVTETVYFSGDVVIPEQLKYKGRDIPVKSIYEYVWSDELRSVSIPATVEELESGSNPFRYCIELEKIKVDEDNLFYKTVDGVLYSNDGKTLISYPAARPGDSYTIPREVEEVKTGAFVACKNLKKIEVEDGNKKYKSINGALIEDGNCLIAYPVGNKASKFVVPDTVTRLGQGAFYMSELEEIVCKSVESIPSYSFGECKKLRKIVCGIATEDIEFYGYDVVEIAGTEDMTNLKSLCLGIHHGEDGNKTADLHELGNLKNLEYLRIEDIHDLSGLTWLENLQHLKTLIIQDSKVKESELCVISYLTDLTYLRIGGIKEWSDLSWINGLDKLESLEVGSDDITVEDFSLLLDMPNLQKVRIYNHSENENLKEFEKMLENSEMIFIYDEYVE